MIPLRSLWSQSLWAIWQVNYNGAWALNLKHLIFCNLLVYNEICLIYLFCFALFCAMYTCAFLSPCFRIFLAHWKKSWMHSPCRKKDIYLCSAQVDMVVIKGIVQSHCHHILDKTKSLSVASWLLLPIIVIHLVIGPAYYLFVIFWTRPDHC